jgi:RNA polymerase sigma-70 factor (ECF subfamily)
MGLLQKGSNSALDEIYARYSKKLLAFIYRMVNGNEALAQDILHDIFLKIIEKPQVFDVSKNFKPWIYQVAANAGKKAHSSPTNVEITDASSSQVGKTYQPNITEKKELNRSLNSAICRLSDDHKAVFVLKHQQQMSIKEIAEIVQVPQGTVKSRLFTATKQLAKHLQHLNPKRTI